MFPIMVRYSLWMVGGWMLIMLVLLLAGPRPARSSWSQGATQPADGDATAGGDKARRPVDPYFGVANTLCKPMSLEDLVRKPLHSFLEPDIHAYLQHLAGKPGEPATRVSLWARKGIGQPHRSFALGEFPFELRDPDPLYSFHQVDSVGFCEQVYALSLASDWSSFMLLLQRLRYRDGQISLDHRNNDVATEWNDQNGWLFEDVSKMFGGAKQWAEVNFFWSPKDFFNHMRQGSARKEMSRQDVYVPRLRVPNVLPELLDGDLVEMVKGSEQRATIDQMGIVVHSENGEANLIYCAAPEAKQEPLLAYLQRNENMLGMKFLRFRPLPEKLMELELARVQIGPPRGASN